MCLSEYLNQNTLMQASFHTLQNYGACYRRRLVRILSEQVQSCICFGEFSQFICSFLLSLCGVLTSVSCAIVVVNVQVYFSLFKTVLRECLTFLIFYR